MGLAELKGKIESGNKTLTDPFDGKDCVYWHIHIQQYMKRGKDVPGSLVTKLKNKYLFFN